MFPDLEDWTEGLNLKLANGQEWSLIAAEPLRQWLQKFGRVMQMQPRAINGRPKLIFCPSTMLARQGSPLAEAAGTGWNSRDLGAMRLWTNPQSPDMVCEIGPAASRDIDVLRMWFSVDIIHSRAIGSGGLPLHAGLVVRNGEGVLLAGPGGAGKSTCCRRISVPWESPCDDEVLVVPGAAGEFRGHPFPTWSDYLWGRPERTWNVQDHFPIKGILFLKQAEKDHIEPVGLGEAAMLIHGSANQVIFRQLRGLSQRESAALRKRVFDNACNLAQQMPAFVLSVGRDGSFWVEIEKALNL